MGSKRFGKHPLQRIALTKARPVSRETLRAMGWDEASSRVSGRPQTTNAKKTRMALRDRTGAEPVGMTTLITKADLSREDEVRRESARLRQAFAKARFALIEVKLKKRLTKIGGNSKRGKP